ncbi:MAG TPA: TldD/PmbA family protein [Gemmatimonadaceae bacterium]
MSVINRRDFLKTGTAAAAFMGLATTPGPLLARLGGARPEPVPPTDDPRLKALTARALDAARGAGATYADVRLTHTWARTWNGANPASVDPFGAELLAVGVRALAEGQWGFASGPVWSPDEMARLGREAVFQAKANAVGKREHVELAPAPVVPDGRWVMPVAIDPFELSPFEMSDLLAGVLLFTLRQPGCKDVRKFTCSLYKLEKTFASTEGSHCTLRTYRTGGELVMEVKSGDKLGPASLDCLSPAGLGWELFAADRVPLVRDVSIREMIRRTIEETKEDLSLPIKPADVGRYDAVLDARSVANLVHATLGPATELDRALGYEANAGGTSWLSDPFGMVGSYRAGAPSLTLTADRSEPGGCATVGWDDDGVAPDRFTLVQDGVLADFQTTRESAGWMKDYYAKAGRPYRSHGCAAAPSAVDAPLQRAPNLTVAAGREALDFDALVAGIPSGIAIRRLQVDMDFQHLNGLGLGRTYEIKNGKRVAIIAGGGGLLFRASELWKGLKGLGGAESLERFGAAAEKGEPAEAHFASVTAPPAAFAQLTLIDVLRKA